jgi:outer membrane immunogenic protein
VGWGYSDSSFNDRDGFGQTVDAGLPLSTSVTDNGVVGGVQAGYNWQRNCTVFGFEADWSWSGVKASAFHQDGDQTAAGGTADTLTVSSNMKWFGTVRGRAGVVVDDVLLYATAGLAYANFRHSWTYFQDGPVGSVTFSSSDTKFGLVAGFGAEWQVANSWSLKSEALYMAFEKSSVTGTGNTAAGLGTTGVSYRLDSHDSVWVARLGANYRFGGSGI